MSSSFVEKHATPDVDDGSSLDLVVCSSVRPCCCPQPQILLIKKDVGGIIQYYLGLVVSVFRGSLSKSKSTPRKFKVSKPMGVAVPTDAVAKVLVTTLQKMDQDGNYVATALSESNLVVVHDDVICEMGYKHFGQQNGKVFFSLHEAGVQILKKIDDGGLNPLTVFLQKSKGSMDDDTSAAPENVKEFKGFCVLDFPRGNVGQKNLKAFFERLPPLYQEFGIKLLDDKQCVKIDSAFHTWQSMAARCALYFEVVVAEKKGSNHSNGVYHTIAQFPSSC